MQFTFVSVDILEKDPTHQGCMGETDSQTRAVRGAGHETSLAGTERSRSEVYGGARRRLEGVKKYPYLPQEQGLSMRASTSHQVCCSLRPKCHP